jgi:predicted ABC-type ATPase
MTKYDYQYGFTEGRNTHQAIRLVLKDMMEAKNFGFKLNILFIDLSNAYDSVDRIKLT